MPWGANRLHNPSALIALKAAVVLDKDSPSGVVWAPDYNARRASPGQKAGSFDERLGQWIVSVKGYPLYARHAVWMLANDQPIPQGMDIKAVDGNLSNVDPANLVPAPKTEVRRPGSGASDGALSAAAKNKAGMPHAITLTDMPHGCVLNIHIKRQAYPLAIFANRKYALFGAYVAAMACDYMDEIALPEAAIDRDTAEMISFYVEQLYEPLGKLTPGQEKVKAHVKAMLRAERLAIEEDERVAKEASAQFGLPSLVQEPEMSEVANG